MTTRAWYLAAVAVVAIVITAAIDLAAVSTGSTRHAAAPPSPSPTSVPVSSPALTPTPSPTATPTPAPALPKLPAETVVIPAQHVRAPVDVCQIVDDALEPPQNVHRTCYWAGGARLDASGGTTVLTGHINWVGQGTGAFGNLARLRRGETLITAGAKRKVTRWRIVRVEHRPKTQGVDTAAFAGRGGARRLYLISCGGAFDASELSYVDNIYVLATPVSA